MCGARLSLLAFVALSGCGAHDTTAPPRSPTVDYPLPAAQTSNGEVIGADRIAPGDKLQEGPRTGTPGLVPAGVPGAPEKPEANPRPCSEIGLVDASGKSRCKKPEGK